MSKYISVSLMQEKPRAAVFQQGKPVLIPSVSKLPERMACAKADAEAFLGDTATKALAIVPSFYTMKQRDALYNEAKKAGLYLKRFLSPPAAAALTDYRRKEAFYSEGAEKTVLICTLTGHIFDAAVASISNGVVDILATDGVSSRKPKAVEKVVHTLLDHAGVKSDEFHRVLMIGEAYYDPDIQPIVLSCVTPDTLVGIYEWEDVDHGGAIQCDILTRSQPDLLLMNVTPHSLGIRTAGGDFLCMIQRGTTIPVCQKMVLTNVQDNQTSYDVSVYEGDAKNADQNTLIRPFYLYNQRPCVRETVRYEICMEVDSNGGFHLSVKDLSSGEILPMTYNPPASSGLLKPVGATPKKPEPTLDKTQPVSPSDAVVPLGSVGKTIPLSPPEAAPSAGAEEMIRKFLPVYDDLLLALEQPTRDEAFKKGVRLTMKKLTGIFTELGAEFYGSRGESFDPKIHNAVMHIDSPQYGENTITKVLQKGVKLHGKILRFAMVEVAN